MSVSVCESNSCKSIFDQCGDWCDHAEHWRSEKTLQWKREKWRFVESKDSGEEEKVKREEAKVELEEEEKKEIS